MGAASHGCSAATASFTSSVLLVLHTTMQHSFGQRHPAIFVQAVCQAFFRNFAGKLSRQTKSKTYDNKQDLYMLIFGCVWQVIASKRSLKVAAIRNIP